MTAPFVVAIGPILYKIIFDDLQAVKDAVIAAKEYDSEMPGDLENVKFEGCITYQDSTICVNVALEETYKKVVLMHEILHGLSTHSGADLTEKQCDQLAYAIVAMMNDNPGLIDWFQGTI